MKTNSSLFTGIKKIITVFILTSLVITSGAQNNINKSKIGLDNLSVMASVSGNGFGLHYSPMAGLRLTKKIVLSAGPLFRVDKPYFAGYTISGRIALLDPEYSFSNKSFLYAFLSFEKNRNQYFSKNWTAIEELTSRHTMYNEFEFTRVRFSGFEVTTGFAVGHCFTEDFSLSSEFGFSVYKSNRLNYENVKLYHEPAGFVLHFSVTAKMNINRN